MKTILYLSCILLATVGSLNADGGDIVSVTCPCHYQNNVGYFEFTSGEIISHGGPPEGSFDVNLSVSLPYQSLWSVAIYDLDTNTEVFSGVHYESSYLGSFQGVAGRKYWISLYHGNVCYQPPFHSATVTVN
jgi:hypothetical protein